MVFDFARYPAEDFARVRFAEFGSSNAIAMRCGGSRRPWVIPNGKHLSDREMSRDGWTPVFEDSLNGKELGADEAPASLDPETDTEKELRDVVDRVRNVLRDAHKDGVDVVTVRSVRAALEGRPPGALAAEQYLRAFMEVAADHTEAIDYGWLADDLLQTLIDSGEITSAQNKS